MAKYQTGPDAAWMPGYAGGSPGHALGCQAHKGKVCDKHCWAMRRVVVIDQQLECESVTVCNGKCGGSCTSSAIASTECACRPKPPAKPVPCEAKVIVCPATPANVALRTQFAFCITDKAYVEVLACALDKGVNIVAAQSSRSDDKPARVHLVVGTPDGGKPLACGLDDNDQIAALSKILRRFGIIFDTDIVIQVLNLSANQYATVYSALVCQDITVCNSYMGAPAPKALSGEPLSLFFQVPQKQLARAVNTIQDIAANSG